MAMQLRTWMTMHVFNTWILDIIPFVCQIDEIIFKHCHLLILDDYNNHVTLEIVQEARMVGLDLVIFHCIHHMLYSH